MAEWLVRCNRNLRWLTHNEPKWFARLIERGEERERESAEKRISKEQIGLHCPLRPENDHYQTALLPPLSLSMSPPLFCQNTTFVRREKERRKSIFVYALWPRGLRNSRAINLPFKSVSLLLPTLHLSVYSASIVRCSLVHRPPSRSTTVLRIKYTVGL